MAYERAVKTRCIVLCGGSNRRWKGYKDIPTKHFADLGGEVLLHRTLSQLAQYDSLEVHLVIKREDKKYFDFFPPSHLYHITLDENIHTEAYKYLSSKGLWNREGRTVVLLGDVWFSDRAMKRIIGDKKRRWSVFGRSVKSFITGCPYRELFAQSFWPEHHKKHYDKLQELDEIYRTTASIQASGWAHYRMMNGIPHDVHAICLRNFVEVSDFTDDIDSPEDYERWNKLYREWYTLGTFTKVSLAVKQKCKQIRQYPRYYWRRIRNKR